MFVIRADGNERIGAGHLMRCLTIAGELARLGRRERILFVCADDGSAKLAGQYGFEAAVLGTDYRDMESELPVLEGIFGEYRDGQGDAGPVILVDSYYVTDRYLERLRRFGTIALMDDLGQRKYPVDVVINYNAPAEPEHYRRLYPGTDTGLLVGSAYIPVREQFLHRDYRVRETVQTVLITAGGGDGGNLAWKLLRALYDGEREYHLVSGQFNPHFQTLKQMEEAHGNIHIHCNVKDMAGLMAAADLAVTAGGSTVYELAVLGVPFICFSCAGNQEPLTEYIGRRDIAGFAGAYHKNAGETLERMAALFGSLSADAGLRRRFHEREKAMVDGMGAARLAAALAGMSGRRTS